MPVSELFPVICTAYIPISRKAKSLMQEKRKAVEAFLEDSYTGSEQLVPGTPPSLVILRIKNTSEKDSDALSSSASQPSLQPFTSPFTSPFLGQSVEDAAQHPVFHNASFFAALDERSARDNTALLVALNSDGSVRTARVAFSEVQKTLISLDVGAIGVAEIQSIAAAQGNEGVYGAPVTGQGPQKGGPAPRKRLGA